MTQQATVVCDVPARAPPIRGSAHESAGAPAPPCPASRRRTPSRRPTLLVVEDDRDYRFCLRLCLDRLGYNVVEACDGAEAVRQYLNCDADVILTDIFMPEMDGVELIRALQALRPDLPIVAFSGAVASDQSGVGTCGARVPLLSKPVDLMQLSAALLRAIGDGRD